jgi:hypothetical protein
LDYRRSNYVGKALIDRAAKSASGIVEKVDRFALDFGMHYAAACRASLRSIDILYPHVSALPEWRGLLLRSFNV